MPSPQHPIGCPAPAPTAAGHGQWLRHGGRSPQRDRAHCARTQRRNRCSANDLCGGPTRPRDKPIAIDDVRRPSLRRHSSRIPAFGSSSIFRRPAMSGRSCTTTACNTTATRFFFICASILALSSERRGVGRSVEKGDGAAPYPMIFCMQVAG